MSISYAVYLHSSIEKSGRESQAITEVVRQNLRNLLNFKDLKILSGRRRAELSGILYYCNGDAFCLITVRRIGCAMEITIDDLELYRRFDGDLDGLSRSADLERDVSEIVWAKLESLRQKAFIVSSGKASAKFSKNFEDELSGCSFDGKALEEFWEMVSADVQAAK